MRISALCETSTPKAMGRALFCRSPGATTPTDCPAPEAHVNCQRHKTGRPTGLTATPEGVERRTKHHRADKPAGKADRRVERQRRATLSARRLGKQPGGERRRIEVLMVA